MLATPHLHRGRTVNQDSASAGRLAKAKSRRTSQMSLDKASGRYCAKLGRKLLRGGGYDGHKFRFTPDLKESERSKIRIQQLWDRLVAKHGPGYLWTDEDLLVAQAMAEGRTEIRVSVEHIAPMDAVRRQLPRLRTQARLYATEIARLQETYPEIAIVAADPEALDKGKRELVASSQQVVSFEQNLARPFSGPVPLGTGGPTVAQALDAYEAHIRTTYLVIPDQEEGIDGKRLSDTGQSYLDQIAQVRVHNSAHLRWPLSRLTFDGCDEMLQVWRQRPVRKDGSGHMAVKTCREHAKLLKRFFKWVSKSDKFEWKKPEDFDELSLTVPRTNREKSAPVTQRSRQVETYTVEQLAILNRYAIPFERFLLLCGLNLGFKRMECATLRVGEISLHTMHDFAKYIAFDFSETDSFVRRLRTKTEVYGEWILWPLTVSAMEWVLKRRRKQVRITKGEGRGREIPCTPTALVFLNDSGHSFTKPTANGNPNHQITNGWTRLLRRVKKDHEEFPWLPHESLRDTAADWIREEFGGEIADIFLSHGSPLGSNSLVECYTNKPFGKVFKALRWLEEKLSPMFEATPANPFPDVRKKRIGGLSIRQQTIIHELLQQGLSAKEIAAKAGCSKMSVYRCRHGEP